MRRGRRGVSRLELTRPDDLGGGGDGDRPTGIGRRWVIGLTLRPVRVVSTVSAVPDQNLPAGRYCGGLRRGVDPGARVFLVPSRGGGTENTARTKWERLRSNQAGRPHTATQTIMLVGKQMTHGPTAPTAHSTAADRTHPDRSSKKTHHRRAHPPQAPEMDRRRHHRALPRPHRGR